MLFLLLIPVTEFHLWEALRCWRIISSPISIGSEEKSRQADHVLLAEDQECNIFPPFGIIHYYSIFPED